MPLTVIGVILEALRHPQSSLEDNPRLRAREAVRPDNVATARMTGPL